MAAGRPRRRRCRAPGRGCASCPPGRASRSARRRPRRRSSASPPPHGSRRRRHRRRAAGRSGCRRPTSKRVRDRLEVRAGDRHVAEAEAPPPVAGRRRRPRRSRSEVESVGAEMRGFSVDAVTPVESEAGGEGGDVADDAGWSPRPPVARTAWALLPAASIRLSRTVQCSRWSRPMAGCRPRETYPFDTVRRSCTARPTRMWAPTRRQPRRGGEPGTAKLERKRPGSRT